MEIFIQYAQEIGLLAAAIGILRLQLKERHHLMMGGAASKFTLMIHYFAMNAYTAGTLSIVAFLRSLIMSSNFGLTHRKWVFSLSLFFGLGLMFIGVRSESLLENALMATSFFMTTWAETSKDVMKVRLLFLTGCLVWLTYAVMINSYGAIILMVFTMLSNFIGIYRHHVRPQKVS